MDWSVPFIIYRITKEGKLAEVFQAGDLKKAKYWLTYIAQPGDVLCKTPAHPKHSKSSKCPEYWSHKEPTGASEMDESAWKQMMKSKNCELIFPEEQLTTSTE